MMFLRDPIKLAAAIRALNTGLPVSIRCVHPWFGWLSRPRAYGGQAPHLELVCRPQVLRQVLQQMNMKVSREVQRTAFDTLFTAVPVAEVPPAVVTYSSCEVFGDYCVLDGRSLAVKRGNWAFYVPALQMKILYARHGQRWCLHPSRPPDALLASGEATQRLGPYSLLEWRNALSTSVLQRTAENYVSTRRLAAIGAGPKPGKLVIVDALSHNGSGTASVSAGFEVADLTRYVRKAPTRLKHLDHARVTVDRIQSALRQQIRGYVSDLDSVVGVLPQDAEPEIATLEAVLRSAAEHIGLQPRRSSQK